MEGYEVDTMDSASKNANIIVTTTGCKEKSLKFRLKHVFLRFESRKFLTQTKDIVKQKHFEQLAEMIMKVSEEKMMVKLK